jgi:hypothetical protein
MLRMDDVIVIGGDDTGGNGRGNYKNIVVDIDVTSTVVIISFSGINVIISECIVYIQSVFGSFSVSEQVGTGFGWKQRQHLQATTTPIDSNNSLINICILALTIILCR